MSLYSTDDGTYWCGLCGRLHKSIEGSEENIMKTGWHNKGGVFYNLGMCNGVHRDANAPKHLGIRNRKPAVH